MKKIIKFGADWCPSCKVMSKALDNVSNRDEFILEAIDIDTRKDLVEEFGIRGVPTTILMDSNIEVKRFSGVKNIKELEQWIES